MKKFYLSALALLAISAAQAQLTKGRVLIGGGLGFGTNEHTDYSSGTETKQRQTGFSFRPSVGLFVKDNLLVGVDGYYGHSDRKDTPGPGLKDNSSSYSAGVFATRYWPLGSGFFFTGTAAAGYGGTKQTTRDASTGVINSSYESKGGSISAYPGISYAFRKHFMIDMSLVNLFQLNYNQRDTRGLDNKLIGRDRSFGASVAAGGVVSFNIGFNILLGK